MIPASAKYIQMPWVADRVVGAYGPGSVRIVPPVLRAISCRRWAAPWVSNSGAGALMRVRATTSSPSMTSSVPPLPVRGSQPS